MILAPAAVSRIHSDEKSQTNGATMVAYRGRTMALLRRYFRMSLDIGRLPSLLGREFFRARVTSYRVHSFEDVVILVHDVERCLEKLDEFAREMVARVVFQDYSWDETAVLMGYSAPAVSAHPGSPKRTLSVGRAVVSLPVDLRRRVLAELSRGKTSRRIRNSLCCKRIKFRARWHSWLV